MADRQMDISDDERGDAHLVPGADPDAWRGFKVAMVGAGWRLIWHSVGCFVTYEAGDFQYWPTSGHLFSTPGSTRSRKVGQWQELWDRRRLPSPKKAGTYLHISQLQQGAPGA